MVILNEYAKHSIILAKDSYATKSNVETILVPKDTKLQIKLMLNDTRTLVVDTVTP